MLTYSHKHGDEQGAAEEDLVDEVGEAFGPLATELVKVNFIQLGSVGAAGVVGPQGGVLDVGAGHGVVVLWWCLCGDGDCGGQDGVVESDVIVFVSAMPDQMPVDDGMVFLARPETDDAEGVHV